MTVLVREAEPSEYDELGDVIAAAYRDLGDGGAPDDYHEAIRDVAGRAAHCPVLVAVEADGTVLGGATFVPDRDNPMCEHQVIDAASIRMMAVRPEARGRGVATALTRACLDRARSEGRRWLILHSSEPMKAAQRLYEHLGFVRDPTVDWSPAAGVTLLGFRYDLGLEGQ